MKTLGILVFVFVPLGLAAVFLLVRMLVTTTAGTHLLAFGGGLFTGWLVWRATKDKDDT